MTSRTALIPDLFRPVESSLIRLGSDFDGGYVVARKAIEHSDHLLSFGLNTDWTFEADFAAWKQRTSSNFSGIDAYDPTLTRWLLCRSTVKHFGRKLIGRPVSNIGTIGSYHRFFDSENTRHHHLWIGCDPKPNTVDFDRCISALPVDSRVYVKMDIEGSEYEVLDQITACDERIAGISIEFHSFGESCRRHAAILEDLQRRFHVVHVHANNFADLDESCCPDVIEVSYINKKLIGRPVLSGRRLPLAGLDYPNKFKIADYGIRFVPSARTAIKRAA